MVIYSIVLFLIAALGGLYMLTRVLGGTLPPLAVAGLHGVLAATGLVLLLLGVWQGAQAELVIIGAVLLVLAALGGFLMLFGFHLRQKVPPKPLALIHGLAALAGVGCLAAFAFGLA